MMVALGRGKVICAVALVDLSLSPGMRMRASVAAHRVAAAAVVVVAAAAVVVFVFVVVAAVVVVVVVIKPLSSFLILVDLVVVSAVVVANCQWRPCPFMCPFNCLSLSRLHKLHPGAQKPQCLLPSGVEDLGPRPSCT